MLYSCSLCCQGFDSKDPDLTLRQERHQKFHFANIPNVVHGIIEWETKDD